MKNLIFCLCFVNSIIAQVDSTFYNKQEIFLGINRVTRSKSLGFNLGYSRRILDTKKSYYRVDLQYFDQFENSTYFASNSDKYEEYYYKNLNINSITVNNMLSWGSYHDHKAIFYTEIGIYLGVNLWHRRKGTYYNWVGYYQYDKEDIKKNYFILPSSSGVNIGCAFRINKKILLKPDLRLGVFNFVRLAGEQKVWNSPVFWANFNVSYLL